MDTEKDQEFQKKVEEAVEKEIGKCVKDAFEGCCSKPGKNTATQSGAGGAVWFLGFIGAVVYYIKYAAGFWEGVLGFLKALVWPAFLVYEAMKSLAM